MNPEVLHLGQLEFLFHFLVSLFVRVRFQQLESLLKLRILSMNARRIKARDSQITSRPGGKQM